ncbi:predicted protein [Phaeodactylum tricornutum CCAP 1055/1]|uniref:SGNH hydrolase-type esterase domain-containing protein n=1 Tax=Phaeodactylum tricornutum (strain CCAP 1055/1) TaxID=556484 RepID=B5Y584_PHATC|nr:predicted protein [Phaeodactylum tricornutum CCAP 1055/1]ACI65893.1 predicted protein [Phaeodactylum tricornutum CCAP 1055/1]|eukprot:XP_002186423.1 predicted protein [Phaeodactylum tricornutum CCAP 1055/1]
MVTLTSVTTGSTQKFCHESSTFSIWSRRSFWLGILSLLVVLLKETSDSGDEVLSSLTAHKIPPLSQDSEYFPSRCIDPDDRSEMPTLPFESKNSGRPCQCQDPTQAAQREATIWDKHHETLVQITGQNGSVLALSSPDVVFLGDSITERMMGTGHMGTREYPASKAVFDRHFNKEDGTLVSLRGLALGSSGDTSPELLWHLENGLIPPTLRPKVWVLLVGTNDLGRAGCSKRTALAGILNAAHHLNAQQPETPLVIHGLLPRSQDKSSSKLGRYWVQIQWINSELKRIVARQPNWHYIDSQHIFLQDEFDINAKLLPDGLHPNAEGYDLWLPLIAHQVSEIILRRDPS